MKQDMTCFPSANDDQTDCDDDDYDDIDDGDKDDVDNDDEYCNNLKSPPNCSFEVTTGLKLPQQKLKVQEDPKVVLIRP